MKDLGGFNQPIAAGVLPDGLTHLTISRHYRHPLPQGLNIIRFGEGKLSNYIKVKVIKF